MKQKLLIIFILCFTFTGKAQESQTFREFLGAYNFTNKFKEGKQFKGSAEFKFNNPHQFNNYSFSGALHSLNKKSDEYINFKNFRPRYWVFGTGLYYNDNLETKNRFEIRFIQGTSFFLKIGKKNSLKNYLRIEERFQRSLGNGEWSDGYRFRYKLSTAIPLDNKLLEFVNGLYIPISLEAFVNLEKAELFNDVLRLSFGLGYKINPNWKVEADLVYKRTQDQGFNINSDNFLFRLRLFNTFKKGQGLLFKDNDFMDLIEDE